MGCYHFPVNTNLTPQDQGQSIRDMPFAMFRIGANGMEQIDHQEEDVNPDGSQQKKFQHNGTIWKVVSYDTCLTCAEMFTQMRLTYLRLNARRTNG